MATFWPSVKPVSLRPCRMYATRDAYESAEVLPSRPITGFFGRWARAGRGHIAAEAKTPLMKSRRRTRPCPPLLMTTPISKVSKMRRNGKGSCRRIRTVGHPVQRSTALLECSGERDIGDNFPSNMKKRRGLHRTGSPRRRKLACLLRADSQPSVLARDGKCWVIAERSISADPTAILEDPSIFP